MDPERTLSRRPRPWRAVVIPNTAWESFKRTVWALRAQRNVRIAYDRGDLEISSLHLQLDDGSWDLAHLVCVLAEELDVPLKGGGTVVLRRRRAQRAIQPDACFWLANAHKLAHVRKLNLRIRPPPDLVIEVDVSRSRLNRFAIYAALGVSEVWRIEGPSLTFFGRSGKEFSGIETSRSFPLVTAADLLPFLDQCRSVGDQSVVTRDFRAWIRARRGSPPSP